MIKVKGIQVAPAELEDLLLGHAMVEDCAVIGIRDDYAGERPFGFVALKDGMGARERVGKGEGEEDVVEKIIMRFVRERKVRSKWLIGVRIVEVIPKSASGKILRRVLRDEFQKEVDGRMMKAKL